MIEIKLTEVSPAVTDRVIEAMSGEIGNLIRQSVEGKSAVAESRLGEFARNDPSQTLSEDKTSPKLREQIEEVAKYHIFLEIWNEIQTGKIPITTPKAHITSHVISQ